MLELFCMPLKVCTYEKWTIVLVREKRRSDSLWQYPFAFGCSLKRKLLKKTNLMICYLRNVDVVYNTIHLINQSMPYTLQDFNNTTANNGVMQLWLMWLLWRKFIPSKNVSIMILQWLYIMTLDKLILSVCALTTHKLIALV